MLAEMKSLNAATATSPLKVQYPSSRDRTVLAAAKTTSPAGVAMQGGKPTSNSASDSGKKTGPAMIGPGNVYYAMMTTSVDTDQPGPVTAVVEDGPLANATLIGSYTRHGDHVVVEFQIATLPNHSSFPIEAIAVDANTNRTAIMTSYSNHDLDRFSWLLGGAFLQGIGQSAQQSGTSITSNLGGFEALTSPRSLGQDSLNALGTVGQTLGDIGVQQFESIKPTVRVHMKYGIGLLFIKPVFASAVEQAAAGNTQNGGGSINNGMQQGVPQQSALATQQQSMMGVAYPNSGGGAYGGGSGLYSGGSQQQVPAQSLTQP
jgi:hypothetical protein